MSLIRFVLLNPYLSKHLITVSKHWMFTHPVHFTRANSASDPQSQWGRVDDIDPYFALLPDPVPPYVVVRFFSAVYGS